MSEEKTIPAVPFRIFVKTLIGDVVKTLSGDNGVLCCPICGCEHVHPEQVTVEQGEARTIVTGDRTEVITSSHRALDLGSFIGLEFWCEDGHSFAYDLTFRRGQVHLSLSAGRSTRPVEPEELWRE